MTSSWHIAHATIVHTRYDTRILYKQCVSLARAEIGVVSLFVPDGKGHEVLEGVHIRDIGRLSFGRLGRLVAGNFRLWTTLRGQKVDLLHIHDPELLIVALLLKFSGTQVVFDMHENLPKEILSKPWVRPPFRRLLSVLVRMFQLIACRVIPTVFAESSYSSDFPSAKGGVVVLNFPIVDSLVDIVRPKRDHFTVGYIGGVSTERGADVLIDAVTRIRDTAPDAEVVLVGPVSAELEGNETWRIAVSAGWSTATGRLKPNEGWSLMAECHVGVAILRPSPNFVDSYPTKLFEYMALGLPVVVSNFPLWKTVVDEGLCGLAVDPCDTAAVADALTRIRDNPQEARLMGVRGRHLVVQKYNWASEFAKLHALYSNLLEK